MFKVIDKNMSLALFFVVGGYASTTVCSVFSPDSIIASSKESDKKEAFSIEADARQFKKIDLKDIPFGCKRLESDEERYFLVEKGTGFPIGLISFIIQDEEASIEKLGIRQDLQRNGHGKRLLNYILSDLKQRRIKNVSLTPTTEAIPFYRNNGFSFGKMGCLERRL